MAAEVSGTAGQWPPTFSDNFLRQARQILDDHPVFVIAGDIPSNRAELANTLAAGFDHVVRPDPQISASGYATLCGLIEGLDVSADSSAADVRSQLRRAWSHQPVVVLLDADLRDVESVAALTSAADDGLVRVIATASCDGMNSLALGHDPGQVELDPIDRNTVASLLEDRFSARPHPTVVTMLQARSTGSYSVMRAVAELAWERHELMVDSGVLVFGPGSDQPSVPGTGAGFDEVAAPRVLADDHPARDVLAFSAFVPRCDWKDAHQIFTDEELKAALRSNVVHKDGSILALSTPIEGLALRHRLTREDSERLLDRAAGRLERTSNVARSALPVAEWIVSTGRRIDVDLAQRAASEANRQNRYEATIRLAEALEPGAKPSSRILVEHAYALQCSGATDRAIEALLATSVADIDDDDFIEFLYWCILLLPRSDSDEKLDEALRHAEESDSGGRAATIELGVCFAQMFQRSGDELVDETKRLLNSGRLSPINQAVALTLLAVLNRHRGTPAESVQHAERARRLVVAHDAGSYHRDFVMETLIISHLTNGDPTTAAEVLTEYGAPGAAYGNLGRLGGAVWGMLEYERGDLGAALACGRSYLTRLPGSDPWGLRGWTEATMAQVLVQAKRPDEARQLLNASMNRDSHGRTTNDLEQLMAQAKAYDLMGEPELALGLLEQVNDSARELGLTLYEVESAGLLVQIDGPHRLSMLLAATAGHTDLSGTSRWWQRFGDSMASNDMRGLIALAHEIRERTALMSAAEVAQFTLDVARRASDMSPAERDDLRRLAEPMQHRHVER